MTTVSKLDLDLLHFAGRPDDGRHRPEMLQLAQRLAESQRANSAVFLWLHDEAKLRTHLDYHLPDSDPLSGVSLFVPREHISDRLYFESQLRCEKRVSDWLERHRVGTTISLFPIAENLGFLNFFADGAVAETDLIRGLCMAIAARIQRHRVKRKLDINDALVTTSWDTTTTVNAWLQSAASITQEHTKAKLVVVFRLNSDLQLQGVAASPSANNATQLFVANPQSLVRKIYQEASDKRILNHYDLQERRDSFGTDACDNQLVAILEQFIGEKLASWIGSTIRLGNDPVAVMFVANKKKDEYLPAVFSKTDYALVQSICNLASKAMPQVQTFTAIRQISAATFGNVDAIDVEEPGRLRATFDAVREHIPGLVGAAIGIRLRPGEVSIDRESKLHCDPRYAPLLQKRLSTPIEKANHKTVRADDGVYYLDLKLPNIHQRFAVLHLLLKRPHLAEHERDILNYLCLDLGQFVRDKQALMSQKRELIEFRHAIRSGLQGLGHLDVACELYDQITKRDSQPSELRMGMLRKSLSWARLFATRTRHLVEQTRYLIDEIRRDQLRLADCELSRIVRETIKCLQPDAEKRQLTVNFVNDMPAGQRAVVDRFLIEITMFNLLDNAIKYSFRGRDINIHLRARGSSWELLTTNFGVYIHQDDYEAIFRPRVRRPTGQASATRPGTGIGLAVVKQVINAHNGRIHVSSFLNKSNPSECAKTTFTITVPLL